MDYFAAYENNFVPFQYLFNLNKARYAPFTKQNDPITGWADPITSRAAPYADRYVPFPDKINAYGESISQKLNQAPTATEKMSLLPLFP